MMFYLVNCEELDGKSLLEYIESQNVRLQVRFTGFTQWSWSQRHDKHDKGTLPLVIF